MEVKNETHRKVRFKCGTKRYKRWAFTESWPTHTEKDYMCQLGVVSVSFSPMEIGKQKLHPPHLHGRMETTGHDRLDMERMFPWLVRDEEHQGRYLQPIGSEKGYARYTQKEGGWRTFYKGEPTNPPAIDIAADWKAATTRSPSGFEAPVETYGHDYKNGIWTTTNEVVKRLELIPHPVTTSTVKSMHADLGTFNELWAKATRDKVYSNIPIPNHLLDFAVEHGFY